LKLGVGEDAALRARVLEAVEGLLGLRDGIVRPGAIRGTDEADDGIALLWGPRPECSAQICLVFGRLAALFLSHRSLRICSFVTPCQTAKSRRIFGHCLPFEALVLGQHALHIMQGRVESGLDDRLDAPLAENLGDLLREGCQPGGGAGDEDAGLSCVCAHAGRRWLLPRPQRHMVHGIDGEFALGGEYTLADEFGALLGEGHTTKSFVTFGQSIKGFDGFCGKASRVAAGLWSDFCLHGL